MKQFLPDNLEPEATSGERYMKFEEGDNKIRILDSAIVGLELWVEGKPVRIPLNGTFSEQQLANADTNTFTGQKKTPQRFWAFAVWNYQTESIQVLELTQKSIREAIQSYIDDEDWGSPFEYDLVITKIVGDQTKYSVKAKPAKSLSKEIEQQFIKTHINLKALFSNGDPFTKTIDHEYEGGMIPDGDIEVN